MYFNVQSEAVVNAGPAVFISQTGPNPIMVQVIFSRLAGFQLFSQLSLYLLLLIITSINSLFPFNKMQA